MTRPPVARLVPLTEDFPASTALAFVGAELFGACAGEGESYVMRWPALPGPYEPLIVLANEAVAIGGTPAPSRVLVVTRDRQSRLGATLLDLDASRKAELVAAGDLLVGDVEPLVLASPDGRLLSISGARVAGGTDRLTLVFEVAGDADEPRRWMLTGFGTRWHEGRLLLLQEHGVSAWTPADGAAYLGDAPPHVSPDGAWACSITDTGLSIRGRDGLDRTIELEEAARELAGWLGPRPVLGRADAVVLDPATLEVEPLAPAGHGFRAASPDGRTFIVDDGSALFVARLPTRE